MRVSKVLIGLGCSIAMLALGGCGADSKGQWCGILDMGYSGEESFCPEADAPERCEDLRDTLIDHIIDCGEGVGVSYTDEQLDDIAAQLDCEEARALRPAEDECKDAIPDEPCGDNGVPELPASCQGVVVSW